MNAYSSEVEYSYSILCHDCFFDNLNKVVKEYELEEAGMQFFILTKDTELELEFQPAEFESYEDDAEQQEGHMEDFIKEILEA